MYADGEMYFVYLTSEKHLYLDLTSKNTLQNWWHVGYNAPVVKHVLLHSLRWCLPPLCFLKTVRKLLMWLLQSPWH